MNPKKPAQPPSSYKIALAFSGIGIQFAIWIIIGYLAGAWLAKHYELSPLWKGLGAVAGMLLGLVSAILLMVRYLRGQDE